jgi:hypothetical protein
VIDTLYNFTDRHTVDYEQIRRKKRKKTGQVSSNLGDVSQRGGRSNYLL